MKKKFALLLFLMSLGSSFAQTQKQHTADDIYKNIEKLNFLGTVLYVGAHPDDENTAMISYLSNKKNARVGYISMTRGDGGQNILGPELRELLGVIRTEELLAAREIDGGEQFFTRANDFGYSKNPTETFRIWDKNQVLSDVVRIFRKFKPDVIIDRFNHRTEGDTHGHHTASARLAVTAFDKAGDQTAFPKQLDSLEVWKPTRLYFNDSWFFYRDKEEYQQADHSRFLQLDLGEYLPITGKSNTEIAALSRSQHKSQAFGSTGARGRSTSYFEPVKGKIEQGKTDIFSGINTTWNRLKGGRAIGKILQQVQRDYNFKNPAASIPKLLKAYRLIANLKDDYWRVQKTKEIKKIIAAAAGLYMEASSPVEFSTLGEKLEIHFEAINRSSADVVLKKVSLSQSGSQFNYNEVLSNNADFKVDEEIIIPHNLHYTTPYWLRKPHTPGMYTVNKQQLIGLPETPPQLVSTFHLTINGVAIDYSRELIYKTNTATKGEVNEPLAVVPAVSVGMKKQTLVFADQKARTVKVEVKAYKEQVSGEVHLNVPKGWSVSPKKKGLNFDKKGITKRVSFTLTPPKNELEGYIRPVFSTKKNDFSKKLHLIDYPHIPTKTVLLPAETKVNRIAIKTAGKNIAYIKGADDKIPESLEEIGYKVTLVSAEELSAQKLSHYDAVILGIRIYNVNEALILKQKELFDYVKKGGTLITQYSQKRDLKTEVLAPFKLHISNNRVTDEQAKVKFLTPEHPVLNKPNKITAKDFAGWVQERGLYFADQWGKELTPILGMYDKGEAPLKGGLLVGRYGEGCFVYTGLSFFRQLPNGVPGAYRLFANLLAL